MISPKAVSYTHLCRRSQKGWFDLSFGTISGYAGNGAIIHYDPTPETDKELRPEGFLLVDSGGQYEDGTTDITRTIALGPITDVMKAHYTCLLYTSHSSTGTANSVSMPSGVNALL